MDMTPLDPIEQKRYKLDEASEGKPVNSIVVECEHGNGVCRIKNTIEQPSGLALMLTYAYHGEYYDAWVIQLDQDGNEKRRFNTKFIREIEWIS